MALSFHPEGKKISPNFVKCSVHRRKDGLLYIDMDGYVIALPSARDYADVVEHLLIMQECFENGFTFVDCIHE